MPAANTLGAIAAIVARLKAQVDSDLWTTIASIEVTAGARNVETFVPAIFVTDLGSTFSDVDDGDVSQVELQQIVISVCVKNVRDPDTVAPSAVEAGKLKAAAEAALIGWVPADGYGPLAAIARDPAEFDETVVEYATTYVTACAVGS